VSPRRQGTQPAGAGAHSQSACPARHQRHSRRPCRVPAPPASCRAPRPAMPSRPNTPAATRPVPPPHFPPCRRRRRPQDRHGHARGGPPGPARARQGAAAATGGAGAVMLQADWEREAPRVVRGAFGVGYEGAAWCACGGGGVTAHSRLLARAHLPCALQRAVTLPSVTCHRSPPTFWQQSSNPMPSNTYPPQKFSPRISDPLQSGVVEVKADLRTIPTGAVSKGYMLRFPRMMRMRWAPAAAPPRSTGRGTQGCRVGAAAGCGDLGP
jgi:hypothetical protein